MKEQDSVKSRLFLRWMITLLIFTCLSLLIVLFWNQILEIYMLLSNQEAFNETVQRYGILGPVFVLVLQFIQVVIAAIPGQVIVIATGYAYGFWLGFLLSLITTVGISQLVFSLSRWGGRPLVTRFIADDTLQKWDRLANRYGFAFFTIAFLLPIFPTDLMNYVAGLSSLSAPQFFIANLFGRLPGVLFYSLLGAFGITFSWQVWLVFLITGIVLLAAGRFLVKKIEYD